MRSKNKEVIIKLLYLPWGSLIVYLVFDRNIIKQIQMVNEVSIEDIGSVINKEDTIEIF